jgi:hypothetical protein
MWQRTFRDRHEVSIKHISNKLMIVDPITKSLSTKKYRSHVRGAYGTHYFIFYFFFLN